MMGKAVESLKSLFGPSTGGLSIFDNNPFKRSAQNVEALPSPSPPVQEGKRKKRLSSDVNVVDRELHGDAARKYRKLEEVANLDAKATDSKEILAPLHGQGNGVAVSTRKRKHSSNGDSGRSGQQEEQILDEGGLAKEKKKKKKQAKRDEDIGRGEERSGAAVLDGENVESVRAVKEVEEAGARAGHGSAKGTAPLEKEENIRQRAGNSGGDVEVASPGKRKRSEGEESHPKKKTMLSAAEKAERLLRTIFVGNLPINVKKKALIKEFSQFGAVESARLRSVPLVDSKLPRKAAVITGQMNEQRTSLNAYVVFNTEECAKAAVAHNMKEFEGRHIRVDLAGGPSKEGEKNSVEYDKTRSIFVGNLPFDVEDEELITLFAGTAGAENELEGVRVVRDRQTSIGKGFAFVLFKTKEGASRALYKRSITLRDRKLRVYRLANSTQVEKQRQNHERRKSEWKRTREPNSGNGQDEPPRKKSRGPLPYEGARASKVDGKPGKWTGPKGKPAGSKGSKRPGGAVVGEPKAKRPAVAARKAASLNQNKPPLSGNKRKREDKGKTSKGNHRK